MQAMRKIIQLLLLIASSVGAISAQEYRTAQDIYYRAGQTDVEAYAQERCNLDVCYPAEQKGFKTLVWFHGGGLTGGSKDVLPLLQDRGIATVAVNYRLSPRAEAPAYIDDAAAAVAWVFEHIAEYGGDPDEIYVGGHSAGGYLALMIALDKSYMARYGADADRVKAYYPVSGQTATHYQIRAERGLPMDIPLVDGYAPLAHIRKDAAPILLLVGQSELELACRTAENYYLYEALRSVGNQTTEYYSFPGSNHDTVREPAAYVMMRHMGVRY